MVRYKNGASLCNPVWFSFLPKLHPPNTIHSYSTLSIYPFLKGRECEKAIRQAKVSSKTLTTELNDPDKKETWAR